MSTIIDMVIWGKNLRSGMESHVSSVGSGTRVYAESGRGAVRFGIFDNFSFCLFVFLVSRDNKTFLFYFYKYEMRYGPPTLFYFNRNPLHFMFLKL